MTTSSPDERDPLALLQYALEAMAGQAAPEPNLDELRRLFGDLPAAVRRRPEVEEAKARVDRPAARVLLLDLAYGERIREIARQGGATLVHYERAILEANMALRPGVQIDAEAALRAAGQLRSLRPAWQRERAPETESRPPLSNDARDAYAANLIARHPERSIKDIAREVGVSRRRLYEWPLSSRVISQRRDDRAAARAERAERLRRDP